MMSKRSVQRKPLPLTTNADPDLLVVVESVCARAGDVMRGAARVVTGSALGLGDEAGPAVFGAALEHVADELEGLSDRALRARTGGGS